MTLNATTYIKTFESLPDAQKKKVLNYFQELLEDLEDHAIIQANKNEPFTDFREYLEERKQKQKKVKV